MSKVAAQIKTAIFSSFFLSRRKTERSVGSLMIRRHSIPKCGRHLGSLTLAVIKIGRHGDYGISDLFAQIFSAVCFILVRIMEEISAGCIPYLDFNMASPLPA